MLYLTYTRQTATTQLSNQSLVTGISPSDWKMAEVSPIFKNGSKSDLELSAYICYSYRSQNFRKNYL